MLHLHLFWCATTSAAIVAIASYGEGRVVDSTPKVGVDLLVRLAVPTTAIRRVGPRRLFRASGEIAQVLAFAPLDLSVQLIHTGTGFIAAIEAIVSVLDRV